MISLDENFSPMYHEVVQISLSNTSQVQIKIYSNRHFGDTTVCGGNKTLRSLIFLCLYFREISPLGTRDKKKTAPFGTGFFLFPVTGFHICKNAVFCKYGSVSFTKSPVFANIFCSLRS